MKCDNCEYCVFDGWEGYWDCALHIPYKDDKNGNSGCKYTKKMLDKKFKEQHEWIEKWICETPEQ